MLAQTRSSFNFHGRSFLAFVLTPSAPLREWLLELDDRAAQTPDFFASRPLILDLSKVQITQAELNAFLLQLQTRNFRLISVEGVDPSWLAPALEPLPGGKDVNPASTGSQASTGTTTGAAPSSARDPDVQSLTLSAPLRSGQSIYFPKGDVSVCGSVASGAEIVCGGSVHIYGALRGRAIAGSAGNAAARIFCRKFEAELIVIGGFLKSSENFDPALYGKPVQAWLEDNAIMLEIME